MRIGDFDLQPDTQQILLDGEELRVEPKVFAVIEYLVRNRERVVPKQELLETLWKEKFVSESALTRVIRDARRILGDSSSEPRYIRTVYGKGFHFVGEVESTKGAPEAKPASGQSIAILPFEDLSADGSQAFFCEGLADETINALTRIGSIDVVSRRSSFEAVRREKDPKAVGRLLGVANVLEGSVRRADNRIRVSVTLVDVERGVARWNARYDRGEADVFSIQEDIAEQTAAALGRVIGDDERRAIHDRPHPGVRAWEYFLKGRQLFYEDTMRTHEAARQMFARAIEAEPDFALGWSGLANVLSELYLYFERDDKYRKEADRSSARALELDDSLADVHASRALALAVTGCHDDAVTELETAIALDPRSYDAHYQLGRLLWTMGRPEQGIMHLERAAAVRPDEYMAPANLMQAYYGVKRESDRHNAALRTVELTRKRLELRPDDVRALCYNAEAHYILGEKDKAMKRIDDAYRIDPSDVCTLYNSACVFALDGQTDRALTAIEGAVRGGYSHREWLEHDPDLAPLLEHPRFRALIEALPLIPRS